MLRASLTDIYLRYVKESLQPFLIRVGALLCLAAVMTIIYELKRASTTKTIITGTMSRGSAGCCLPRCLACCWSPRPRWAPSPPGRAARPGCRTLTCPPLPEGDPARIGMLDCSPGPFPRQGESMRGRTVKLSGFLSPGPGGRRC